MNNKKIRICLTLVNLNKKKIKSEDISAVATMFGVKYDIAYRAFRNYVQFGTPDLRSTTGYGTIKMTPKIIAKRTGFNKNIDAHTAATAILDYMNSNLTSREICNKYDMSVKQFYGYIRELNISGKLMGHKVLGYNEYAKNDVLAAIRWRKSNGKSSSKRLPNKKVELGLVVRVAQVLQYYLAGI